MLNMWVIDQVKFREGISDGMGEDGWGSVNCEIDVKIVEGRRGLWVICGKK